MQWDVVIRNGKIVDGSGEQSFSGDIAIKDGKIAAVGSVQGQGAQEIDAKGLLVTPGFVDIHTHYDGQAMWDSCMAPSSWHGATTVVMGNCGVGFAPCKPEDHARLIRLMEGVEDIPGVVLDEGLKWNWETFPEFLDALEERPRDIDVAAQLPHGAMRLYVMGERAERLEVATPEDMQAMAAITREAIAAGAIGFSTSRTLNHKTSDGNPTPSLRASQEELQSIANALQGEGVLQFVSDFENPKQEMAMLETLSRESGRPLSVTVAQTHTSPESYKGLLEWLGAANNRGVALTGQVAGRPVGLMLGFRASLNPFIGCASFQGLMGLSPADRVERLQDPAVRDAILAEFDAGQYPKEVSRLTQFSNLYILGENPDYEQTAEQSIAALAKRAGVKASCFAYDELLKNAGKALLYLPFLNYANGSLDPSLEMLNHPNTVPGLGDGGAHLGIICDSSLTTHLLSYWTRDRKRGDKVALETAVKWQTHDTARTVGLMDRGLLKPGYKADINIIDYNGLRLHEPEMVWDLPHGSGRLMQGVDGYKYTLVSGQVVYENGQWTGATPGKLVRGAQAQPSASLSEGVAA